MPKLAIAMDPRHYDLDIFGQQPGLKIYTQITLCYQVANAAQYPEILHILGHGLERLASGFPWVAGQISVEDASEGNTGVFKIKPHETSPLLVVKDWRGDPSVQSMEAMRQASFPFSMLDENMIAPRNTIPGSTGEEAWDTTLVFLVQANLIIGGLLLTFVTNHNAMDLVAQAHMMHMLSKACHDEPFTMEELTTGNLDRRSLVSVFDESWEEGPELDAQRVEARSFDREMEGTKIDSTSSATLNYEWAYFIFDSTSLSTLKSLAMITIPSSCSYITTDDAISSLIWQSVTGARLPRLHPSTKVLCTRSVDVRRYLNIPATYPGLMQNLVYHYEKARDLVKRPLGVISSKLRSAIDPKSSSIEHDTRALATVLTRVSDKNTISLTANINPSQDLMISSWSKADCYGLDFNLGLGKPEAVRRPRLIGMEGLVYLMPRRPDGEVAVAISLRSEDMERLRADKEFTKWGKYIG